MVSLAEDLMLALDRVAFARALGLEPDGWQEELLRYALVAATAWPERRLG
jgi:hypothetical protein